MTYPIHRFISEHIKEKTIHNISVDTRNLEKGDLFFALPGERVHGITFIQEAFQKGASAVVASKKENVTCKRGPIIFVDDPLQLLHSLAQETVTSGDIKVLGITGSIGKTTTKEFVATLFSDDPDFSYSLKSMNSQIGLPLTILNRCYNKKRCALEMGMSKKKELSKLIEIAPPQCALLTQVALAHSKEFKDLKEIALEKATIFSHPKTELSIINYDIPCFAEIYHSCHSKVITYSTSSRCADYVLIKKKDVHYLYKRGQLVGDFKNLFFDTQFVGNGLAAIVVALEWGGFSWEKVLKKLSLLTLPPHRFQRIQRGDFIFIDDAYNACQYSIEAALQSLPKVKKGSKKIALLGEMKDLGAFSQYCHQQVGVCALDHVEQLYCLGNAWESTVKHWRALGRIAYCEEVLCSLLQKLKPSLSYGDLIFLKGANQYQLWKVPFMLDDIGD